MRHVPTNNIKRGTIFTWGADIEQSKVSDGPARSSKTDSFKNRRAEFITKVNLNEEQCIEAMPART
jgi:hypothetical protein